MLKRRLPPGAAEAAAGAGASAPKVGNAMARPRRASFFMSFPGVEGGPDGREADADPMADPSACQIEKASLVLEYPGVSGRIAVRMDAEITPTEDGPLHAQHIHALKNSRGETIDTGDAIYLCRCGQSR